MKKHALGALFLGLMACGGGKDGDDTIVVPDSGGTDGGVELCNPLAQTGCNADEKCTWIHDQDMPQRIGHVGCAPVAAAPKAIGEACTPPTPGPMGYDDCAAGSVCLDMECKAMCDLDGGSPACDSDHSCARYSNFLETGGQPVAGVCDPGCDPLTQQLKVGDKAACGSPTPEMPTKGCYGFDEYSCSGAGDLDKTDRKPAADDQGNVYLNGCAPGFMPIYEESSTSTVTICSGLCAALEIDNTPAHKNNNLGDGTALGKDPTEAGPAEGHATCAQNHRGSTPTSSCRFLWPFLEDDAGELPPLFENSVYLDTLGWCMDPTQYTYNDDDDDGTPDVVYPDCATLPPYTPSMDDNDAGDWLCQKRSTVSAFVGAGKSHRKSPVLKQMRLPFREKLQVVRHTFN